MTVPATVSEPFREAGDVLALTEKVTIPVPLPLAPVLIVIQFTLLVAVQPHPPAVVTAALFVPPSGEALMNVGATLKLHAPLCVTVTVSSAIVNVPVRSDVEGLAAIE